jgi:hypothetical protein
MGSSFNHLRAEAKLEFSRHIPARSSDLVPGTLIYFRVWTMMVVSNREEGPYTYIRWLKCKYSNGEIVLTEENCYLSREWEEFGGSQYLLPICQNDHR